MMNSQWTCTLTKGNETCLSVGMNNLLFTCISLSIINAAVIVTGMDGSEVLPFLTTGWSLPQNEIYFVTNMHMSLMIIKNLVHAWFKNTVVISVVIYLFE